MVPKGVQATIAVSEENDEGFGIACIISFFRDTGQDGIYRGVGLMGNAYRAFSGWGRHSIHTLERHGLESDIFVLINNLMKHALSY